MTRKQLQLGIIKTSVVLAIVCFATSHASATTALSNLDKFNQGNVNLRYTSVYQSFTTGSDSTAVDSVSSISVIADVYDDGNLNAYIYTYDASKSGSAMIGSLAWSSSAVSVDYTGDPNSEDAEAETKTVSFSVADLNLDTNTSYCIRITSSIAAWDFSSSSSGYSGLSGWSFGPYSTSSEWKSDYYYFTDIEISSVPEPATYAGIAGIGALVLAFVLRRKA
jgi:hypothetical protein